MPGKQAAIVALTVAGGLALGLAAGALVPARYSATARLMLPGPATASAEFAPLAARGAEQRIEVSATGASRVVLVRHQASDPSVAASVVNDFVRANIQKGMQLVDPARTPLEPAGPGPALAAALGAAAGLLAGVALVFSRRKKLAIPERPVPPFTADVAEGGDLCEQLASEWFAQKRILAVGGPAARSGRSRFVARLAMEFAARGERTLVVDGSGTEAAAGVQVKPVDGTENLFVLLAAPARLARVVSEASRRFTVVLVDAPEGNLEPLAALSGGVLLIAPAEADAASLKPWTDLLLRVRARVVATVKLSPQTDNLPVPAS